MLLYINAFDFCILLLYPVTLPNLLVLIDFLVDCLGFFPHTRSCHVHIEIVLYLPFQSEWLLLEHRSGSSEKGIPVLFLIAGRNHPVFRCVPVGSEHACSISVCTADSDALTMSLVTVPKPQNEEVDLKGPSFPVHTPSLL